MPSTLLDLLAACARMSEAEFGRAYPSPVLVQRPDSMGHDTSREHGMTRAFATARMPVFPMHPSGPLVRITVGRGTTNDVQILAAGISKQHAVFGWRDDGVYVEDASSTNGTFVDGHRLSPGEARLIASGCEIRFGSTRFRFFAADDLYNWLKRWDGAEKLSSPEAYVQSPPT